MAWHGMRARECVEVLKWCDIAQEDSCEGVKRVWVVERKMWVVERKRQDRKER